MVIERIDFSNNYLYNVNIDIARCTNLSMLNLANNKMSILSISLPERANFTLFAQNNYLIEIDFNSLPSKLIFVGHHNKLQDMVFLRTMNNVVLQTDLNHNKINSWSALIQTRLKPNSSIDLRNNPLTCDEILICMAMEQQVQIYAAGCAKCEGSQNPPTLLPDITTTKNDLITTGQEEAESVWDLFDF